MFRARLIGMKEVRNRARELGRRYARAWHAAAFTAASDLITATIPDVPRETGELRASCYVTRSEPAEAGFGASYAAVVHEMPIGHAIGRWKFLEAKLNEMSPELAAKMAKLMKDYGERGVTIGTVPAVHRTKPREARQRARSARVPTPRRRR